MPLFKYEALDATGRSLHGELAADTVEQVTAQLSLQGMVPVSIELAVSEPPQLGLGQQSVGSRTIPAGDRTYIKQLDQALTQSGDLLPVLDAIAAEPASRGLRPYLALLSNSLRGGVTAEQFLQNERLSVWLPIVLSNSQAQSTRMNERYAQWLTQVSDERNRWRSIWALLTYPLVLLGCILIVVLPIALFIVPTFQHMFRDFGLTLPGPTRLVFALANAINHYPHYLILGLALIAGLIVLAVRYWLKHALATRYFGFMISGNSMGVVAMSRLTSTLAELLEAGAPLGDALVLAGVASRHAHYRDMTQRLAMQLANPQLQPKMAPAAQGLPDTLMHALSAAKGNQPSIPLIRELAQMYSSRLRGRLNRRTGLTSPLFIIAIGLVVGMVVLALFMPLVQMITSLA